MHTLVNCLLGLKWKCFDSLPRAIKS